MMPEPGRGVDNKDMHLKGIEGQDVQGVGLHTWVQGMD